jgi:TrmH family RNA methyltransferase
MHEPRQGGPVVRQVSSRDNPLLVRLRKLLGEPGGYRKLGEICLEGDHLCSAYLQRGGVQPSHAVVTEAAWEQSPLRTLAGAAAAVTVVPAALMGSASTLESPPPIAFVVPWAPAPAGILPGKASVVLDRLQDAGNVGAVLRSAAAFGFTQVVALKGTAALWSPKVLRAGMGAHFGLHLVEGMEADAVAHALEVPLLATSSHAEHALHQRPLPWPCAWVMGHEGQGVSQALMAHCAQALRIPQPGGEESLNVAAAAAVCLYESARQRLG